MSYQDDMMAFGERDQMEREKTARRMAAALELSNLKQRIATIETDLINEREGNGHNYALRVIDDCYKRFMDGQLEVNPPHSLISFYGTHQKEIELALKAKYG